jgi:hypothetical protein
LILAKRPRSDTVRQHGQPPLGSEQNINVDSLMLKKKNPHLLGMFLVRKKNNCILAGPGYLENCLLSVLALKTY